jgi:Zn-dependent protease with chaperone function
MQTSEPKQASRWITYRRWIRIILLAAIAAWWAGSDSDRGAGFIAKLPLHLSWLGPISANAVLFWGVPIAGAGVIHLGCYWFDKLCLGRRWTLADLIRLAFWQTLSPTIALLLVAAGFDAIYERRLTGLLWLVAAAILALVGMVGLRSAEGMKLQPVKGGDLYKRAFALATVTKTPLARVCVVPAGRGQLTNAYGSWRTIAVTDNYGKFLTMAELEFVIGHELAHVRSRHGPKKMLMLAITFSGMALTSFILAPFLSSSRPIVDVAVVFIPTLTFYFLSRHFEYAADAAGVALTRDPETAVRALVNLHRITEAPTHYDKLSELFMTHPALVRRAQAIREKGQIPQHRVAEPIA